MPTRDFPDDSSQPPKTVAQLCFDRKRNPTTRFGVLGWRSVRPRPRRDAIGCEKTVIRQTPRVRRPPVQAYCGDDTRRHVGAGLGRRPSISCRIAANSRRGIATSVSWNVTYRPCRTTFAPILISFSRSVVSDQCSTSSGKASVRGDLAAVEFQLQAAVEIDPQRPLLRFTHRVCHDRAPNILSRH